MEVILNKDRSVKELRIVPLGKTGAGKSHTGNILLCDPTAFQTKLTPVSVTHECKSATATVNGRTIKYIDTPGFLDTCVSEEKMISEITRSIVKCAPGPHAFLILLKVERYTVQEIDIVSKITETFGEDALNYAVVLFTHGDNLDEGQTIEEFVRENSKLQDLVNKCGKHCHVIDNKYWNQQRNGYRSNIVQIENLMNTIDEMSEVRYERCYTNEMLQEVQRNIDNEMQKIRAKSKGRWSEEQIREEAEKQVHTNLMVRFAGVTIGILLGALLEVKNDLPTILKMLIKRDVGVMEATGVMEMACSGAIKGVVTAYDAVEGEQEVWGAIQKAAQACIEKESRTEIVNVYISRN